MAAEPGGSQPEPCPPIYSEFADDAEMMELVAMFVDELPDRLAALRSALDAGNLAETGRIAHQIKGAAGGYGFPAITDAAGEIESQAQTGDTTATRAALDAMAQLCQRATV